MPVTKTSSLIARPTAWSIRRPSAAALLLVLLLIPIAQVSARATNCAGNDQQEACQQDVGRSLLVLIDSPETRKPSHDPTVNRASTRAVRSKLVVTSCPPVDNPFRAVSPQQAVREGVRGTLSIHEPANNDIGFNLRIVDDRLSKVDSLNAATTMPTRQSFNAISPTTVIPKAAAAKSVITEPAVAVIENPFRETSSTQDKQPLADLAEAFQTVSYEAASYEAKGATTQAPIAKADVAILSELVIQEPAIQEAVVPEASIQEPSIEKPNEEANIVNENIEDTVTKSVILAPQIDIYDVIEMPANPFAKAQTTTTAVTVERVSDAVAERPAPDLSILAADFAEPQPLSSGESVLNFNSGESDASASELDSDVDSTSLTPEITAVKPIEPIAAHSLLRTETVDFAELANSMEQASEDYVGEFKSDDHMPGNRVPRNEVIVASATEPERATSNDVELAFGRSTLTDAQQGAAIQQAQIEEIFPPVPAGEVTYGEPFYGGAEFGGVMGSGNCQQLFQGSPTLDSQMLSDLNVDLRPQSRGKDENSAKSLYTDDLPKNLAADIRGSLRDAPLVGTGCQRYDSGNVFLWAAPKLSHQPLYFEQPNLERYGQYVHGNCVQSAISAAHFFGSIPLLPYKIGADHPLSCDYTLGHYRPGNCNPRTRFIPEVSTRGIVNESLFITGAFFFVP